MEPTADDFVQEASTQIGRPYVWGGSSPKGFDCSGLVQYALERLGLRNVPRTSEAQYAWADPVDAENVEAGDLVFFHFPGEVGAGHVAIFAGGSNKGPFRRASSVIQAPSAGENVQRVPFTPLPAGSSEWGGRIVGYGRVPGLSYATPTLEALWIHAGGLPKVARTMAAIALAESGGKVSATHTNADGTTDNGLWQINSSHGYDRGRLLSDPGYNARAAVSIYRSQGLSAWTTYTTGAYKAFLGNAPTAVPLGRPPRPGAGPPAGSNGSGGPGSSAADQASAIDAATSAWGSYLDESAQPGVSQAGPGVQPASLGIGGFTIPGTGWIPNLPGIPDPFSIFGDAASAVSDLGTFLKWIAWLFSPRNILRIVEFLAGAGLLTIAAYFASRDLRGSSSSPGPTNVRRATIRRAVRSTPPGRALALAGAERKGRRRARSVRAAEVSKGHRAEEKRAEKRAQARAADRRPGESRRGARARRRREEGDIPF